VPLSGTVRPAGNKNAALPILAACVLTADPVTLDNVPRIRDVEAMIDLLADIGAEVEWLGPNRLRVWAADIRKTRLDAELCSRIRASTTISRCSGRQQSIFRATRAHCFIVAQLAIDGANVK
jgi:UDP-N-acetylglucosamine 1-carboxyvinyltransferase